MISRVVETTQFKKSFSLLPSSVQEVFFDVFELFITNPEHKSLRTHLLRDTLSGRYAFSIDAKYRCIFRLSPDKTEVVLFDIGDHSIYRR